MFLSFPLRGTFSGQQAEILQFSSKLIIFRDKQKISVHIVQRMQHRRISSHRHGRRSFLHVPESSATDPRPLRNQLRRQFSAQPCQFDLLSHLGEDLLRPRHHNYTSLAHALSSFMFIIIYLKELFASYFKSYLFSILLLQLCHLSFQPLQHASRRVL